MVLEAASENDLEELVALLGILFTQEAELSPDAGKQRRALQIILREPAFGRIYVARDDGKVIAMASLLNTVSTAEGGEAALFEDLVVRPEHRGRGIGAALLGFVIGEARKAGVRRITLLTDAENERAQALYRKLGFGYSSMRAMRLKL